MPSAKGPRHTNTISVTLRNDGEINVISHANNPEKFLQGALILNFQEKTKNVKQVHAEQSLCHHKIYMGF